MDRKVWGLSSLAQASFSDLQQVPGVGPSKAAAIHSAIKGSVLDIDT